MSDKAAAWAGLFLFSACTFLWVYIALEEQQAFWRSVCILNILVSIFMAGVAVMAIRSHRRDDA